MLGLMVLKVGVAGVHEHRYLCIFVNFLSSIVILVVIQKVVEARAGNRVK
jgi:hypothetical protein